MSKIKQESSFFDIFAGEFLEIITDLSVVQSGNLGEEGQFIPGPATPMIVNGFLMDCDAMFAYLSVDGEEVDQALPISSIKHVQITQIKSELDNILDEMPDPDPDTAVN